MDRSRITRFPQCPKLTVDIGLELVEVAKQVWSHRHDGLAGVGRIRGQLAVVDHLSPEGGAVEHAGEEPDGQVETGSLVTADRQQEALVGPMRVEDGFAIGVGHPSLGHLLPTLGQDLDRPVRGDGGSDVEQEGVLFAGGYRDRDRVGAEQGLPAPPWRHHVGAGHRHVDRDQTLPNRHRGVHPGRAGMVGVARPHPGHPVGAGLGDGRFRGHGHHHLTQTVVPVDERADRCLPGEGDLRPKVDAAGFDPGHVLGEPDQPVTAPPPQICFEKPSRRGRGVVG